MKKEKMIEQIDVVIEAARNAQAEDGPDPDYRRFAEEELATERQKLIDMLLE